MTSRELPTVSLLVAMRNEEKNIGDCLISIFNQDYPASRIEVFIMDGKSTDHSWDIVQRLIQNKDNYCLINNPKISQSAAWNIGIEKSHGDVVSIVSAHSVLAPDYVSKAIETSIRTGADLVGGPMVAKGETRTSKAISIATSHPFGIGGARFHYATAEETVDTVYMGFCRRELYMKIGGFDEEMVRNQDDELSYRILDYAGRIVCNPEIKSQYFNRATLKSLSKQYYQYGFYKVRVMQKHPSQMRTRQFIPPIFVLGLIGSALLSAFLTWGWITFAIIALSYLSANLIASAAIAKKMGWLYFPLLVVVFCILHLSYGSGFLVGLIKFSNRWNDRIGKIPNFSYEPPG